MSNIHTILIPDVHGRDFWKADIARFPKSEFPDMNIIFFGDYIDPYSFEKISCNTALERFKEIIELAKSDARVKLLLGNHDYHYIHRGDSSRIDYLNFFSIKKIIQSNLDLFRIAFSETINTKKYLYTHAGVTNLWIQEMMRYAGFSLNSKFVKDEQKQWIRDNIIHFRPTAESLNNLLTNYQGQEFLHMVSYYRGGDYKAASCIWADINEHYDQLESHEPSLVDAYQVFAHSLATPSLDEGMVEPSFAMIDSRCTWIIDNDNNILKLKDYEE